MIPRNYVFACGVLGLGGLWWWRRRPRRLQPNAFGSTYDVTDEAHIDASPTRVYDAIVAEHDGKSTWWRPHMTVDLVRGRSYAEAGARVDHIAAVHGKFPIRFTTETRDVLAHRMIRVGYVEGAFTGTGLWTVDPVDGGTRLSYRWQTTPAGSLRFLAPFLPVAKSHSDSMKAAFAGLSAHLAMQPAVPLQR